MDQPCYMTMSQLGWVTFGLTWDGFNPQFINLVSGAWGQDDLKSQLGKECEPERIVLVHIQNSWKSHAASFGFIGRKRLIVIEKTFQFIFI